MRLKGKGEVSSWGSGNINIQSRGRRDCDVSLALQSLLLSSPPLKIYGGPWGGMEECATAHSRAKSTLTASNANTQSCQAFRLHVLCIPVCSFIPLSPRSLFLSLTFPMWRRSRHLFPCREMYADAKLLFMFFYFERLPYFPRCKTSYNTTT